MSTQDHLIVAGGYNNSWCVLMDSTTNALQLDEVHQPRWTLLPDGWKWTGYLCVLRFPAVPCRQGYPAPSHLIHQHWPAIMRSLEDTSKHPMHTGGPACTTIFGGALVAIGGYPNQSSLHVYSPSSHLSHGWQAVPAWECTPPALSHFPLERWRRN